MPSSISGWEGRKSWGPGSRSGAANRVSTSRGGVLGEMTLKLKLEGGRVRQGTGPVRPWSTGWWGIPEYLQQSC